MNRFLVSECAGEHCSNSNTNEDGLQYGDEPSHEGHGCSVSQKLVSIEKSKDDMGPVFYCRLKKKSGTCSLLNFCCFFSRVRVELRRLVVMWAPFCHVSIGVHATTTAMTTTVMTATVRPGPGRDESDKISPKTWKYTIFRQSTLGAMEKLQEELQGIEGCLFCQRVHGDRGTWLRSCGPKHFN